MRFQYVDRSGRKVEVQSLEGLAARLELGAITPETMLYDAVADRWAPAAEHEFFRSLVRPHGRESALPVTPPGLVPSSDDAVTPVDEPGESQAPEDDSGDEEEDGAGDEAVPGEAPSRGPAPSPRASFSEEEKDGRGGSHNALFDLMELDDDPQPPSPSDPLVDALDLSVVPESQPGAAGEEVPAVGGDQDGPSAAPPQPPAESRDEERVPVAPPPPPSSVPLPASEIGPRVLSLDDLGAAEDPVGPGSQSGAEARDADPGEDWRRVSGGPPPSPLKGLEAPGAEGQEEFFKATRSSPAILAGSGGRGRVRSLDLAPVFRVGTVLLVVLGIAWVAGTRWGPWAPERDRIPAELQGAWSLAWDGAYGDLIQVLDATGRSRGLAERPGREWLEGVYLAYASRFPEEGEYWAGLGALIRDFRLSEDSIFRARIQERVGALRLPEGQQALLLEESARRFAAARPERIRVYARAEGIAAAASELHRLLVQHEEEILYEPFTVSGVSRDPVIEAVPTNRPLAETMWSLIDRVTRGLQDMDAIMGVSTRSFVDAVLRDLRSADPARLSPPGSPAPGG